MHFGSESLGSNENVLCNVLFPSLNVHFGSETLASNENYVSTLRTFLVN